MKKLTVLLVLIGIALMSYAQPAPELLYYKTQPNPAFISVSGLTMDFVDSQDYLFTYTSEMRCAGTYQILNDPSFVMAFGKDQWDQGFAFREEIKIGIYDAQTNSFYKLLGTSTDWNNNPADMMWMALNLLRFETTGVGDEIELIVDENLASVSLTMHGPDTWNLDTQNESYFFKVADKNLKTYVVTASQSGELKPTKRWFNNTWNNYQYTPTADVKNVTFTAVGQGKWDSEILQAQKVVIFERITKPDPDPEPEITIIFENQYIKTYIKELSFGDALFSENKTDQPVQYLFYLFRDHAKYPKVSNSGTLKPNEDKRHLYLKNYNAVELVRITAEGNYIRINKTYELE